MNLCINARDAMAGPGTLEVRLHSLETTGTVCTSCQRTVGGRFVELSVCDSGPGVPAAVLPRMFEPFFTTKPQGQGSGMGLATVHGIVHEHGGHLVVENRPGGGAVFRVLMPAVEARQEAAGRAEQEAASDVPATTVFQGRVLLVDDDPMVRGFMTELLESWGLSVTAFDRPLEARAVAERSHAQFDVAICDYIMPQMTGLDLARELRALRPLLPVLLYSGYADGLADTDLADAGIHVRLAKPVDTVQLFAHLERIIRQD
jgi:CheY-like chemotaxis protein